jgi:CelD/BcsL family acetyltransferase involved in cellulose biosynthesis
MSSGSRDFPRGQGQGGGLNARDPYDPPWVAFVESQPDATVFHLPVWSALLASAYGYRPFVLAQSDAQGRIVAGLPAMEVRSPLTGRRIVALPFTDYCPPLAREAAGLAAFAGGLRQWWESAGRPSLEIRGSVGGADNSPQVAVRHTLALEPDPERVFQRSRRDSRQSIQRARRDGVDVRLTRSRGDLDAFYRLHVQTRRRLGVPVQPRHFMDDLWARVIEPGLGFAVIASAGTTPISGAIFLAWNGRVIYKYSASDAAYRKLRPNKLVVWTAMEWACRNGYREFDYGKTDFVDEGLRDFKRSFGSLEIPLTYAFLGGSPSTRGQGRAAKLLGRVIQSSPPVVCRMAGELLYGHFG